MSFIDMFTLFCYGFSITNLVIISVGWLTCTNYYFKLDSIGDGIPLVMHTVFMVIITVIGSIVVFADQLLNPVLYLNMGYWSLWIVCTLIVLVVNKIIDIRYYFAKKRGRV